jgi:hypothetical protein
MRDFESGESGISGTCYGKDENGTEVKMCPESSTTFVGAAQICAQCNFANNKAFCPDIMGEPTCDTNTGSFLCDGGAKVTEFAKCPLPTKNDADDTCLSCDFAGGKAFCPDIMGEPTCASNTGSFLCDSGAKVTSQQACSNYALNGYRRFFSEEWVITEYENSGEKQLTAEENAAAVNSSKNAPSADGKTGISDPGYCAQSYTTTTSAYGVKTSDLFDFLNGAGKVAAGWFADFEVTKTPILVTGIPLAILLAFSWIWFMKNFGKCVCWLTLILSFMSCVALNLCLYVKAGIIGNVFLDMTASLIAKANPELADQVPNSFPDYLQPSETRKTLYKWSAIAMTAFLLICFVMMIRFRQKINVAIQMCKEAAAAIIDMPLLVFWPFVNVVFLTCFMVYFVYIAMYISSAANLQQLNVKLNDQYQANMAKMTALGNDAIDAGNAGMGAAVDGYNSALAKIPDEATINDPTGKVTDASTTINTGKLKAYTADDWNAVQHMSWNTTTVQPLEFSASKAIRGMLVYHTIGMWWGAMALVALGYFTISSAVSQWYFNTAKFLEQSKRAKSGKYSAKTNCLCCQCSFQQHFDSPVMDAMQTGCRYHCGSIACGSGLNIIVFFLKMAFLWINRLVSSISNNNVVARKIKACMFISMLAFDRYIRIITRNAYIMIAIRGKGFFQSSTWASWLIFAAQDNPKSLDTGSKKVVEAEKARKAFNTKQKKKIAELENLPVGGASVFESISFSNGKIVGLDDETKKEYTIATQKAKDRQLIREKEKLTSYEGPYKEQSYNAAQYAVLSLITDILLFLGKLVVVVMSGIASYAWIDAQYGPSTQTISSSAAPVAVSMLFSYFIASSFMSVYDMSIDTILLCFFYDKLQNKGGPYAMSPTLKKLVIANLPPGVDKTNMRKGDSFFFSQMVTEQGSIALGAGWDAESKPDADSGKVVKQDVDLALAIFNHDAQLLDYIGYMDCPAFNGVQGGMLLKKTTGGKLFPNRKDGTVSHLNKECVKWSGDDTTGAKSSQNVAGINEDITVRLHEMPQAVNTLAFMLFSFKGPTMDKISDLRLIATECTTSDADPSKPRFPEVVAKFNMDFDESTMEGMQRAMLCATLRRNPGPKFPTGKHTFSAEQKTWVDKFCIAPIEKAQQASRDPKTYKSPAELDNFVEHAKQFAEPYYNDMKLTPDLVNEVKGKIDCMFEGEMDHLLSLPQKDKTRKLQKQLAALENKKAKFVMYHLFAMGSEKSLGKGNGLSAHQIMVYTNTYSKHHKTGDQLSPDENIFDCAWELQAQRELMASKKFDASILNNIARKCFFFRTATDKFQEAEGSFIGGAVAAGAAFMVGA